MARLGGVDELRRRAGGGESGGKLLADMAAFAHAGDDQPAPAPLHELNSVAEILSKAIQKRCLDGSQAVDTAIESAPRRKCRLQLPR